MNWTRVLSIEIKDGVVSKTSLIIIIIKVRLTSLIFLFKSSQIWEKPSVLN